MKNRDYSGKLLTAVTIMTAAILFSCSRIDRSDYTAEGVSSLLATYRYETLSEVHYNLSFQIDEGKESPINGRAAISFRLKGGREPLLIDFRVPDNHLESVTVNGKSTGPLHTNSHIVIDRKLLKRRHNLVEIGFRAGDLSLNRNEEYLYTLLVPDRASTAFPCLDQPDIKGRFTLTLNMPVSYRAMSNSPVASSDTSDGRVTLRFSETKPISTYLFAFAAGKFELIEKEIEGVKMEMLHREARPGYIENNSDEIFRLHLNAIRWLEAYTGIPYPFDKFGFVLLPPFQYSGMEHPGAIFYRAQALLLEASPTLNEQLARASLIAHETSHIWFGDLVTMKWFDDVWLKEVFAGYMSDKIVAPDFPDVNHDLRFLLSRYPAAYEVDRTRGTNPVIQELGNLKDAGSLYGAIIYNKAPIVMRQLEQLTGEESLRKGLQVYLKEFSWGNARWDDLVRILEKSSGQPLREWSRMWIREAGMPVVTPVITDDGKGEGYRVSFSEDDPAGQGRVWPQTLTTMVITSSDTVRAELEPGRPDSFITVKERPEAGQPLCIIPDISGRAYGTFLLDSLSSEHLLTALPGLEDPLLKGIIWINLYENLLNGRVQPDRFFVAALRDLQVITDEQLRSYLAGLLSSVWWSFLSVGELVALAPQTEAMLKEKMLSASDAAEKRFWFGTLRNISITPGGVEYLSTLWHKGELPANITPNSAPTGSVAVTQTAASTVPAGPVTQTASGTVAVAQTVTGIASSAGPVRLSEDELCTLALTLALKGYPGGDRIIAEQRHRISSAERRERFNFVTPAVSADAAVRDTFFVSLRVPANREREPWVLESLGYLHHPLVAERSEKYILPSLQMLEEIKRTGDIFFPGSWINATLSGHRSPEARAVVEKFLDDHPDYPAGLRLKILQAADLLLRR